MKDFGDEEEAWGATGVSSPIDEGPRLPASPPVLLLNTGGEASGRGFLADVSREAFQDSCFVY